MSLYQPETSNISNNINRTVRENLNQVSLALDTLGNSVSTFQTIRNRTDEIARFHDVVKVSGGARSISVGGNLDSFSKKYPQIRLGMSGCIADATANPAISSSTLLCANCFIDDSSTLTLLNDGVGGYLTMSSTFFGVYSSGSGSKGDSFPSGGETLLSIGAETGNTTFLGGSQLTNDRFKVVLDGTTRFIVDKTVTSILNVIPKTWSSLHPALQIGQGSALWSNSSSNGTYLSNGYYFDGSWKLLGGGTYASVYIQSNGTHTFSSGTSTGSEGTVNSPTERMRLTQAGELLIGTTTASASHHKLVLYEPTIAAVYSVFQTASTGTGSGNGCLFGYDNTAGATIYNYENTGMRFATNSIQRAMITANGELLIGTTTSFGSPTLVPQTIYSSGTASYTSYQTPTTGTGLGNGSIIGHDDTDGLTLYNYENTGMRFATNSTVRATISSGGDMEITSGILNVPGLNSFRYNVYAQNTSTSGSGLLATTSANSSSRWSMRTYGGAGTSYELAVRSDGYLYAPVVYNRTTAGSANVIVLSNGYMYRATSSARYKKNIRMPEVDTSRIYNLRMKTYERKKGGETDHGFIAEQAFMAEPNFCEYDSRNRPDAIHWNVITCSLVEEIKKLNNKCKKDRNTINELIKRIEKLENK